MGKPIFQIAEREGLWTYDNSGELVRVQDHAEAALGDGGEFVGVSQAKLEASYTIATADTLADLAASVCDLVVDGWVPIGAPFYTSKAFDAQGWNQALYMSEVQ